MYVNLLSYKLCDVISAGSTRPHEPGYIGDSVDKRDITKIRYITIFSVLADFIFNRQTEYNKQTRTIRFLLCPGGDGTHENSSISEP